MDRHNRIRKSFIGSAALLAMVTFSLVAAAKLSKTGDSLAGFHAIGPAGFKIEGKTSALDVADDGSKVVVTVKLDGIDTGSSLRNKHTSEDLEASKYPTAKIEVARSALKLPAAGAESSGDAKGSLTIHGQTKDVTFSYSAKRDGDTITVKSSAKINVSDFGVKPRSYLGISIKPNIEIFANFQAKDN